MVSFRKASTGVQADTWTGEGWDSNECISEASGTDTAGELISRLEGRYTLGDVLTIDLPAGEARKAQTM